MASNLGVRSVGAVLLALLSTVLASPLFHPIPTTKNGQLSDLKPRAGDFYLRVMPLGASITYGDPHQPDTAGRGYRKYIRDQLRVQGWFVNMVGSRRYGDDFADNDVEGWPGYTIDGDNGIYNKADSSVPQYKPNVILLNAGTNDATGNIPGGAGDRLERLVRMCLQKSPGVTIVLSTLLPNAIAPDNVVDINAQYRALAAKLQLEGEKVQIAEMHDGFITLDDIWDGTHPTGKGFQKMAAVWWAALELADAKNWFSPPSQDVNFKDGDTTSDNTCDKQFGSGNSDPRAGEQILYAADPLIANDGTYRHSSQPMGQLKDLDFLGASDKTKVSFAQLINTYGADRGGELDEMVSVTIGSTGILYTYRQNYGGGSLGGPSLLDPKMDCDWDGGEWVDMNNDGLDDFVCISPQGDLDVSINKGGNPPTFQNIGRVKGSSTSDRAHVRLADIDGDGRFDYCATDDGGNIHCWRNGGLGDKAAYWEDLGVVFTGKGMGDIRGTRFVDINGDFRSDWLWVDNTGKVTTYINQRGYDKSLVPLWLEAGVTHLGMGSNVGRDNIHFGRIYGSGRHDYAHQILVKDLGDDLSEYAIEVYQNTGSGGQHQKGDGARWGPMSGKGNDDYVWISPDGKIVPFVNRNNPPDTTQYKNGWLGKGVVLETGMDRKALHIGDWDGDGKADIIGVDKKSGALTVWFTSFDGSVFSFRKQTLGGTWCTQGWGVGLFDIGARFADVTGNGCVDYLCMEPNGRTTGWINNCPKNGNNFNLEDVGQIKFSVDQDRANHKWADSNGDGRADFMLIDKFNGDAKVWTNAGRVPESERANNGGSIVHFVAKADKQYLGSSRGNNMDYPNLGGLGRADQVSVAPATGYGWIWYNTCPGGSGGSGGGGDDGGIAPRDPSLPRYLPSFLPLCAGYDVCDDPDVPLSCEGDTYGQDFGDPTWVPEDGQRVPSYSDLDADERSAVHPLKRRRSERYNDTLDIVQEKLDRELPVDLAKRAGGERRAFGVEWEVQIGLIVQLFFYARGYPGTTHLHDPTNSQPASNNAFRMRDACTSSEIERIDYTTLTPAELAGFDTEHNPDLQFAREFLRTLGTGVLPDGTSTTGNRRIDPTVLEGIWNSRSIPPGVLPNAGSSRYVDSPNEYFMDRFGSQGNRAPMVLCEKRLNELKGRIFNLRPVNPPDFWSQANFDQLLDQSLYDSRSRDDIFRMINMVVGVFRYMNDANIRPLIQNNLNELSLAIGRLEGLFPQDLAGAGAIFRDFYPNWYRMATSDARAWLTARLEQMSDFYTEHRRIAADPLEVARFIDRILSEIIQYVNSPI